MSFLKDIPIISLSQSVPKPVVVDNKESDAKRSSGIDIARTNPVSYYNRLLSSARWNIFGSETVYDLKEINRIEDVESYFMQAILRKWSLAVKEGWKFSGRDNDVLDYINTRFRELDKAQGRWESTKQLVNLIIRDLIKFHSAFLIKVRKDGINSGKVRTVGTKSYNPVAALFIAPPETIIPEISQQTGKHIGWIQRISGEPDKKFKLHNVVVFTFNTKTGLLMGTPEINPLKDDIRALRNMEENLELLVHQHLFPIIHFKVGTEGRPAVTDKDGLNEVKRLRSEIESMPPEASLVTSDRYEVEVHSIKSTALDAGYILKHFKQRIITGLGLSPVDFGEADSSNKSTSETLNNIVIDRIKLYQIEFELVMNKEVIDELLLESPFQDPFHPKKRVSFVFNEIDIPTRIAKENETILLWHGGLLTIDEARKDLGRDPITDQEMARTYPYLAAEISQKFAVKTQVAAGNSAQNQTTPTNQHKTKQGPSGKKS